MSKFYACWDKVEAFFVSEPFLEAKFIFMIVVVGIIVGLLIWGRKR